MQQTVGQNILRERVLGQVVKHLMPVQGLALNPRTDPGRLFWPFHGDLFPRKPEWKEG